MINATSYYPKLTEYGVEVPYSEATIEYNSTSVQRLYKIDEGEWKTYNGETIRLEIGQTIYAKGIDKNGDETRIISSYTSVELADAIGPASYDGDDGTAYTLPAGYSYMNVDESMWGKKVRVLYAAYSNPGSETNIVAFINNAGEVLDSIQTSSLVDVTTIIPENTVRIRANRRTTISYKSAYIYEIQLAQ